MFSCNSEDGNNIHFVKYFYTLYIYIYIYIYNIIILTKYEMNLEKNKDFNSMKRTLTILSILLYFSPDLSRSLHLKQTQNVSVFFTVICGL